MSYNCEEISRDMKEDVVESNQIQAVNFNNDNELEPLEKSANNCTQCLDEEFENKEMKIEELKLSEQMMDETGVRTREELMIQCESNDLSQQMSLKEEGEIILPDQEGYFEKNEMKIEEIEISEQLMDENGVLNREELMIKFDLNDLPQEMSFKEEGEIILPDQPIDLKQQRCHLCEYTTVHESNLKRHTKTVHSNFRPHKGDTATFGKYKLKMHMVTRSKVKEHKCCALESSDSELRQHENSAANSQTIDDPQHGSSTENGRKLTHYEFDSDDSEKDVDFRPSPSDSESSTESVLPTTNIRNLNEEVVNVEVLDGLGISNTPTIPTNVESGRTRRNDTSLGINTSIVDIQEVKKSGDKCKQYYCIFCNKLTTKFARHIQMVHKDELEVKKLMLLPKGCEERMQKIAELRKKGAFLHNTRNGLNKGQLLVARRPQPKIIRNPSDYKVCPNCKGFYSKSGIRRHYIKCQKDAVKGDKSLPANSRRTHGQMHKKAEERLRNQIIPKLRDDDVSRMIKYDELAIIYGNKLCTKFRKPHLEYFVRSKLRLVGRLMIEIKKINPNITDFASIFEPLYYDDVIKAVNKVALLDDSQQYKSPATAFSCGTLLKKCAQILTNEHIKNENQVAQKKVKNFLILLTEDFGKSVNRTVYENQLERKRQKKVVLPSRDDIKLLISFLNKKRSEYFKKLKKKTSKSCWLALAEITLISIQVFNRRKAGEIERLLISDFLTHQPIDENTDMNVFNSLSEESKKAAMKYYRFEIHGNLGRSVPVLLNLDHLRAIELLNACRQEVGVSDRNPYVFGVPGSNEQTFLRSCSLMRRFSVACGAKEPSTLRGTELRKQIGTRSILLDLKDIEISDVVNYMGHDEKIDKEHYRLPIVTRVKMSQLLKRPQEGDDGDDDMKGPDIVPEADLATVDRQEEVTHYADENQPGQSSEILETRLGGATRVKRKRSSEFDSDDSEKDMDYRPPPSDSESSPESVLPTTNTRNLNEEVRDVEVLDGLVMSNTPTIPTNVESGRTRRNDTSLGINTSIVDIQEVKKSGDKCKQYYCIFCNKLTTKFARHIQTIHKDELEVKILLLLPKGCEERMQKIAELRKKGAFLHNTRNALNKGQLLVARRPQPKIIRNPSDYKVCPNCKGFYSKTGIRRHYIKCQKDAVKGDKSLPANSRRTHGQMHKKAEERLRNEIIPKLRDDDVSRMIQYDELAIIYGNKLCAKYRKPHLEYFVRSKLRLVGRLMIEIKKINPNITDFASIFEPLYYDDVIKAVNKVALLDDSQQYKSPATAFSCGTLLKKCAQILTNEHIKNENQIAQKKVKNFLNLLTEDFGKSVNRTVYENQLERRRQKKVVLPSRDDIKLLISFLNKKRSEYFKKLKKKTSKSCWLALAEITLISVQVFNRRKAGEIERLLISDFLTHQPIDENTDTDVFKSLSKESKKAAVKYYRFEIHGNLGRSVPVLLNLDHLRAIELLNACRQEVGVSDRNPYVFGVPGSNEQTFLRSCSLMRRFSVACGAKVPSTLRGTELRKQIGTQSILLDLKDNNISDLANLMGHDEKIDEEHYLLPIVTRVRSSQLLKRAQGVDDDDDDMEGPDDVPEADLATVDKKEEVSHNARENQPGQSSELLETGFGEDTGINRKKRSASPVGYAARRFWSRDETAEALKHFQKFIDKEKLPTLELCEEVLSRSSVFSGRTSLQLKAWISNQIMKNRNNRTGPRRNRGITRYWSTEEKKIMHEVFGSHIKRKKCPGFAECREAIQKYSELKSRTVQTVKAWVNNEINKIKKQ